jgi:hypothetical protein
LGLIDEIGFLSSQNLPNKGLTCKIFRNKDLREHWGTGDTPTEKCGCAITTISIVTICSKKLDLAFELDLL